MENESPLKTWVRRHSPLRAKPLPRPPIHDTEPQSADQPLNPISANASPTRHSSRSKLRALLKQKPHPASPPRSPPSSRDSTSAHARRKSMPLSNAQVGRQAVGNKTIRRRTGSTDLHRLSVKISDLENQLKEAKEQLNNVSRRASVSFVKEDPSEIDAIHSGVTLQHAYASFREPGLVTSLLRQRERDFSHTGSRCRSTTELTVPHSQLCDKEEEQQRGLDEQNSDGSLAASSQHKRKRSQVRQASWDQLLSHLNERKQMTVTPHQPDPKRPRKSQSNPNNAAQYLSKELPKPPSFPKPRNSAGPDLDSFLLDPSDAVECENPFPPLDRHQRHFSQPLPMSPAEQQSKPSKHRRSRSQIILAEDLRQALPLPQSENWEVIEEPSARPPSRKSGGGSNVAQNPKPPSPTRRHCVSPKKLEMVEEEFEWDEEIF